MGNWQNSIEEFIRNNGVDERGAEALRTAPPATQEAVLASGDFVGVKNPSSALMSRIRDAEKGKGGGAQWLPLCAGSLA